MYSCLSHTPYWGPGPQPRHVPWLGIEPGPFIDLQACTQSTEPHQPGLSFIFEGQFYRLQNSRLVIFFLSVFKYFTMLSPWLHGLWEIGCNTYLCFLVREVLLTSVALFKVSNLSLIFWNLNLTCLSVVWGFLFVCFHLSCLMFFEFSGVVVWCLMLILEKYSVVVTSNIASVSFSLFPLIFQFTHTFYSYPTVLGYSVLFFPVFFLFAFPFWKFQLSYPSGSEFFFFLFFFLHLCPVC